MVTVGVASSVPTADLSDGQLRRRSTRASVPTAPTFGRRHTACLPYFVAVVALQCMGSLAMAVVDVYAILVGRSFQTPRVVSILSIGDWITGALTFSAASAASGITVLINDDLEFCYDNP
ncbi:CASP-like protein 5A1 [Lolium perenne]|uniref:CASP-like protein 5A1 n=1 Tax=Lolium perenne TaxID=4522 RepID=UPI003A99D0A9